MESIATDLHNATYLQVLGYCATYGVEGYFLGCIVCFGLHFTDMDINSKSFNFELAFRTKHTFLIYFVVSWTNRYNIQYIDDVASKRSKTIKVKHISVKYNDYVHLRSI